jgi:hypothetical protein
MRFVGMNVFSEWVKDRSIKLNNVENSLSDIFAIYLFFYSHVKGTMHS